MKVIFNIEKMVNDLGGAAKVAEAIGKHRTAPYGWIARGKITSDILELIKLKFKGTNIDGYFETTTTE